MSELLESPLLYSPFHWFRICLDVQVFVGDDPGLENTTYLSVASVVERVQLLEIRVYEHSEPYNNTDFTMLF